MTYNKANCYGYDFEREQTVWVFDGSRIIYRICCWAVPRSVFKALGLRPDSDAYLANNGYWFTDFKSAVLGSLSEPSDRLEVMGNCLSMFVHENWAIDNGNPDSRYTYRVFRSGSVWDAELVEKPRLHLVDSTLPDYM